MCKRYYCTEVRAHCVDGTCDHHADEADRKACIKDTLKRLYKDRDVPHPDCKDTDLENAVDKCYIEMGTLPTYPMPIQ